MSQSKTGRLKIQKSLEIDKACSLLFSCPFRLHLSADRPAVQKQIVKIG